jgi:cellulose synthase/poly-beta-1,6-N-acetylglucosamine synthase-like glycosyltransferase
MSGSTSEDLFRKNLFNFQKKQQDEGQTGDPRSMMTGAYSWIKSNTSQIAQNIPLLSSDSESFLGQSSQNQESSCFGLSKFQRYSAFFLCNAFALLCYVLALWTLPFVILAPQKFTLSYTMGGLLSLVSFGFLSGWRAHFNHLISESRRAITAAYIGTLFLTLWAVFFVKNYFLTILFLVIQLITVVWYYVSYLPGGSYGLSMFGRGILQSATRGSGLPI